MNKFLAGITATLTVLTALFLALYIMTGWKLELIRVESKMTCSQPTPAHGPTKGKGK